MSIAFLLKLFLSKCPKRPCNFFKGSSNQSPLLPDIVSNIYDLPHGTNLNILLSQHTCKSWIKYTIRILKGESEKDVTEILSTNGNPNEQTESPNPRPFANFIIRKRGFRISIVAQGVGMLLATFTCHIGMLCWFESWLLCFLSSSLLMCLEGSR